MNMKIPISIKIIKTLAYRMVISRGYFVVGLDGVSVA